MDEMEPTPEMIIMHVASHLAAAISLLEKSPEHAAPSDKMFNQMLDDYRASLDLAKKFIAARMIE